MRAVEGLQVAIDGPSGSGKGTVAVEVGARLDLPVLDSGLLYRFTGWRARDLGVALDDGAALAAMLRKEAERLRWRAGGSLLFDGVECAGRLRGEEVGAAASSVAAQPEVRSALLSLQRTLAAAGCVMDGRDIGTVVLPDAQAKFFLTASRRERARRRWMQLRAAGHDRVDLADVEADLARRDARDRERSVAPLVPAADAVVIDSTTLRVDQVVDRVLTVLRRRGLVV
ncbi:MAG: (d)CMP kinase [Zetaproteobacteria bacterium]|nr:MAG: (d)CMP kinase [Zetaproteobacteria bacterium]